MTDYMEKMREDANINEEVTSEQIQKWHKNILNMN